MHLGKHIRGWLLLALALFVAACASGDGQVTVDASWNLACSQLSSVECLPPRTTCLGNLGERTVVGSPGDLACEDQPIVLDCGAIRRPDGGRTLFLEVRAGDDFALMLDRATIDADTGVVEGSGCLVTIIEDGVRYGLGSCGPLEPSMAQPCQLTNVTSESGEVGFDLFCRPLMSDLGFGLDVVGAVSFSNCSGF